MIKHRAQDKNERGLSVMEKLKLDFYYGREAEQFTFYRLASESDYYEYMND